MTAPEPAISDPASAAAVPPAVCVVVVTWNGWALTRRALASVYAGVPPGGVEVIVVDNGSTDDTPAGIAAEFPGTRYVPLDRNYGFAVANNRALPHVTAPLLLLLNNDAVLAPGALEALLDAAASAPAFDVFATQMLRLRDPARVDNRGLYLDASGHCRQLDAGRPAAPGRPRAEVFGASGGACLVRAALVRELGLFDETLGSYWEDCDFAYRVRAAGRRCLYVPEAVVLHEGSATGDRMGDAKLFHIQRNMAVVCRRWIPFRPGRATPWLSLAAEGFQLARAAARGQGGVVLRAKLAARHHPGRSVRARGPGAWRRLRPWVGVQSRPVA
jgi:GT2 family glycosyltransferase